MSVNYRVIYQTIKNMKTCFLVLFECKKDSACGGEKICYSICAFAIKEQIILHSEKYLLF